MKTLSIKTYLIGLSIAIILCMIAIGLFVTMPTVNSIILVKRNIGEVRQELEAHARRSIAPEKTLQALPGVIEQVKGFAPALFETDKELEIISAFEAIADTHGVLQKLSINSGTRREYRLSITLSGGFANEIQYLQALERLPYYASIKKIDWSKDRADASIIHARFDAVIYVQDAA